MAGIEDELFRLSTMSSAELRKEWAVRCGDVAPRLTPDLMRHGLGYAVQEKALGKLPKRMERDLLRDGNGHTVISSGRPPAGTQLVRSWNGRTISVEVTDDGFVFEGKSYASLSAIAREVTGAHWSGPRFFGLNGHGQ